MQLSFVIKKLPGSLFDYLTNMQKFVAMHPVITKIDKLADGSYLVYERVSFGCIPFSFTYPVTIESLPGENGVIMRAVVMKLIKIDMLFLLKAAGDCTVVEDRIIFKSPLPVKSIMHNIFSKQHRQLFINIERAPGL